MGVLRVRVDVLGPIRVRRDRPDEPETIAEPAGAIQRHLLALLAASAGRPLAAEVLSDSLWGAARDDRTSGRLQVTITRLRQFLGGKDTITHTPLGYTLQVDPSAIDATLFETLVSRALDAGRPAAETIDQLTTALDLWRGLAYQGVTDPLVEIEAQRLTERRLDAVQALAAAHLSVGAAGKAAELLETAVAEAPWREDLAATRMVALARLGRQADAIALYHAVRTRLADDLGLDPGPQLTGALEAILQGSEPEAPAIETTVVPAQLPPRPGRFSGRNEEAAELSEILLHGSAGSAPIAVLSGPAGVGKSSLALHWAHDHIDAFPDGQLHLDLRGWSGDAPVPPETALTRMLRGLGVAVPGTGLEDCIDAFRTAVRGRRMLVVFDNAAAAGQVRDLLPGSPSCAVLITSRDQLTGLGSHEGAQRVALERLTEADALDLLKLVIPDGGDRLSELAHFCAGLPLALRIAAEYLAARPALGLDGLLAELTDGSTRLDVLDGDDQAGVRAVFDHSYDRLDPEAATMFRAIGVLPAPDVDLEAIAAMTAMSAREARAALRTLVAAHLIEERPGRPSHPRFGMHDLLAAYAAERHDETGVPPSDLYDRLLSHYTAGFADAYELLEGRGQAVAGGGPDPVGAARAGPAPGPRLVDADDAAGWIDAELATFIAVAAAASPAVDRQLDAAAALLYGHLRGSGHLRAGASIQRLAQRAARRLGDLEQQSSRVYQLGVFEAFLGRTREAADHFAEALAILGEDAPPASRARLLQGMAQLSSWSGRFHTALEMLDECLRLRHAEQPEDPDAWRDGLAIAHALRANLLLDLDRFDEARQALREASRWANPDRDMLTVLSIESDDAEIDHLTGDLTRAFERLERLVARTQELGLRYVEVLVRDQRAEVLVSMGKPEKAIPEHRWALRESERLGDPTRVGECAVRLAHALRAAGRLQEAFGAYTRGVALARQAPSAAEKLRGLVGLARTCLALDRPAAARQALDEAETVVEGTDLDTSALAELRHELGAAG